VIDAAIGRTPLVRLEKVVEPEMAEVWMKVEGSNPGGSIKDRTALGMITDAEQRGVLRPGGTIVEPTSGNTGIGLAQVAATRGYKLILCLPAQMSEERKRTLIAYGARLVLTITGDRHHYARYEPTGAGADAAPTRITAGGGGAYLSATHTLPRELKLKTLPRKTLLKMMRLGHRIAKVIGE